MKPQYFAKFFHMSTGYVEGSSPPRVEDGAKKLIEACGSDSVFQLDGRNTKDTMHMKAHIIAQSRKYLAYQLCFGTYSKHSTIGSIIKV